MSKVYKLLAILSTISKDEYDGAMSCFKAIKAGIKSGIISPCTSIKAGGKNGFLNQIRLRAAAVGVENSYTVSRAMCFLIKGKASGSHLLSFNAAINRHSIDKDLALSSGLYSPAEAMGKVSSPPVESSIDDDSFAGIEV